MWAFFGRTAEKLEEEQDQTGANLIGQDDASSLLENVNEKIHAVLVINAEGDGGLMLCCTAEPKVAECSSALKGVLWPDTHSAAQQSRSWRSAPLPPKVYYGQIL
eukprot:191387-Pelagomonas_calceolata.AAC.3